MPSSSLKYGAGLAVFVAICYQLFLKTFLFVGMGIGRHVQPISDFPYQCRRIHDKRLKACEDMWLSEQTRQLFLACSDPLARTQWNPNFNLLNASGRSLTDAVIAVDIDKLKGDSFEYRVLKHPSYKTGDGRLYLVGFTGRDNAATGKLDIALVNQRPPMDQEGNILDASEVGGDFTIELFETNVKATELRHKKTYKDLEIKTPNNIAFAADGGFYISNDHGTAKAGWKFNLAPFIGNGDVTHCHPEIGCRVVSSGHKFPNGLLTSHDRQYLYVPSAHEGGITVYKTNTAHSSLTKIDAIDTPYPIDNLSQDSDGDIWVPAFPKGPEVLRMFGDPLGFTSASTIFRVRKKGESEGWGR